MPLKVLAFSCFRTSTTSKQKYNKTQFLVDLVTLNDKCMQVAETPFTTGGSKHTELMIEFIVKSMSAQSFALQSVHACDISVTHLCLIMLFESRSTLPLTINTTVYMVNYKKPIHCLLHILRDKTLNCYMLHC